MRKCNTCDGTYEPIQPDGTEYYHACPPLAFHEKRAALEAGTVQMRPADRRRYLAAVALDRDEPLPAGEFSRADTVLADVVIERPNRRDENLVPGTGDETRGRRIKAPGLGSADLPAEP